jgi:hypothetical protein
MSNENVTKVIWWVCLFVAPLILVGIELFHPAGFTSEPGMYEYLSKPDPDSFEHGKKALSYPGPKWWFTLHMIQTPLVCLVAVGLWLMVAQIDRPNGQIAVTFAWVSRALTFIFIIYYTALDAIGGFGLGRTILITQKVPLTPDQLKGVTSVLNAAWVDSWTGGVGSFLSLTGSWAFFFTALSAAIALFLAKKAPLPPLIILIISGWELQTSHASPHGPIAFVLLTIAAFWIWWSNRQAQNMA